MPIREHPHKGSILWCDFTNGFCEPEMVKRRPVIVLSPKITGRPGLCTVVALSTTPPDPVMPYHLPIKMSPPLPTSMANDMWVKGDMVYAVSFHRLDFIRIGKDRFGNRQYYYAQVSGAQMRDIHTCVLNGLGLSILTKHL